MYSTLSNESCRGCSKDSCPSIVYIPRNVPQIVQGFLRFNESAFTNDNYQFGFGFGNSEDVQAFSPVLQNRYVYYPLTKNVTVKNLSVSTSRLPQADEETGLTITLYVAPPLAAENDMPVFSPTGLSVSVTFTDPQNEEFHSAQDTGSLVVPSGSFIALVGELVGGDNNRESSYSIAASYLLE